MNPTGNAKMMTAVNIRDMIWDLLSQWKAVLIVAVITAILATGAKYIQDNNQYNAELEKKAQAEKMADISVDEQIETVLSALGEEDRATVEYIVKQKDWVRSEKDYIANSILLNENPTNQRTLLLDYYIEPDETGKNVSAALEYAYTSYMKSSQIVEGLREVIDPDTESEYIAELISSDVNFNGEDVINDNDNNVITVKVVLPENADAEAVEKTVTSSFTQYEAELSKSIAPHRISLLRKDEARLYNSTAVNNRTNILYSIYNLQNNYKNFESSLSDQQKGAIAAVDAIKTAAAQADAAAELAPEETAGTDEPAKPGISAKYTVAGFVLGMFIYAFIYVLYVILSGRITSAGQTKYYTGSRLLGEIYCDEKHPGIRGLLHSKAVNRIRYRDKLDADRQIGKMAASAEAVCGHAGTDSVTLLCLPAAAEMSGYIDSVVSSIRDKGINVGVLNITEDTSEKEFLPVRDAIIVSGNNNKTSDLTSLTKLISEYDIRQIGNVYLGRI